LGAVAFEDAADEGDALLVLAGGGLADEEHALVRLDGRFSHDGYLLFGGRLF
jgi:hypothetical protein